MRLSVKQNGQPTRDFQFSKGPISIGRRPNNLLSLLDKTVSKEHAVISAAGGGKWFIEDLDSTNKTYLNDKPISKAEIKTGDRIRITDFTIEITFEEADTKTDVSGSLEDTQTGAPVSLEDTKANNSGSLEDTLKIEASLKTPQHETVVRRPDAHHAPAMRLAAKRLTQFSYATEEICKAKDLEVLLSTLLKIILNQFTASRVWCALRDQPRGPIVLEAGKKRTGQKVELNDLQLSEKITEAMERGQSLVMPSVSAKMEEKERIRSAMIACIKRPKGCFGVLYVDNAMIHDHYSLSDLDYLMLLAMHTAAVLRNHGIDK